jgi:hypothetical protein
MGTQQFYDMLSVSMRMLCEEFGMPCVPLHNHMHANRFRGPYVQEVDTKYRQAPGFHASTYLPPHREYEDDISLMIFADNCCFVKVIRVDEDSGLYANLFQDGSSANMYAGAQFYKLMAWLREAFECIAKDHKRHLAAMSIQRQWRRAIADPAYAMCRRRLLREYGDMV